MEVALRPVAPGDEAFLEQVYGSTRERELALVPWSEEQKRDFVHVQFEAQSRDYAANYPQASFDVVLVDGEPAGRLYVDRRGDETRIVDIALLPAFRGRGVGERLLREVLGEGRPVSIHVERGNPAWRLYERLGFTVAADDGGVYVLMRAQPKTAS